jgi:ferrous iron transport protein B
MAEISPSRKKVILVGNPNVGKSVIFRLLTGSYVFVSNFPGTTVEITSGNLVLGGFTYEVVDTPGVNSLVPQSEDERVTCEILLREKGDLIIQVADAKNLRRTLLLTSQLAEFGIPMILVLNMMDEAEEQGIEIDSGGLSALLSIPVIETIAIYSRGKKLLLQSIQNTRRPKNPLAGLEEPGGPFAAIHRTGAAPLALASEWLAQRDHDLTRQVETCLGAPIIAQLRIVAESYRKAHRNSLSRVVMKTRDAFVDSAVAKLKKKREVRFVEEAGSAMPRVWLALLLAGLLLFAWNELGALFRMPTPLTVASRSLSAGLERILSSLPSPGLTRFLQGVLVGKASFGSYPYGLAPAIVHFCMLIAPVVFPFAMLLARDRSFAHEMGVWTRRVSTGIPILLAVLVLVYEFVGYTGAQTLVGLLEKVLFGQYLMPFLQQSLAPGFLHEFLAGKYGMISMGLTYAIAIVLPVIGTFFIAFSLLEDSGYLPRLSILADRLLRSMGLNGKAALPLVLGLGCCTMATMTTRILSSRKERLIATLLLALGIPCSAQLGVILGIAAGFSAKATILVIGVVVSQLFLVGFLASKLIRGRSSEFIFEIPPIRVPQVKNVLLKTAYRIRWYMTEAVPLFLCGTLALFLLDSLKVEGTSLLEWLQVAAEPVLVRVLHLPAQAVGVFVLGFLRRDYGAAGLFAMARNGMMTAQQTVVSLIVITLFVPCLASFLVIIKERGFRQAIAITAFIIPFAVTVGAAVSWFLRTFDVTFR